MGERGKGRVMRGATIGAITLRLFRSLPPEQCAWLAKAYADFKFDGSEPDDIPPDCMGAWIAVREECDNIERLSEVRAEIGRKGGLANGGASRLAEANRSKPKQTEAKGSKTKQTEAEGEGEGEREEKDNSNVSSKSSACGIAGASGTAEKSTCVHVETDAAPDADAAPGGDATGIHGGGKVDPTIAEELAEAMKGAPMTPEEAFDYATGANCGLTPAQLLSWAEWWSIRGWKIGAAGEQLGKDGARTSMRKWRKEEPHYRELRKRREAAASGGRGGGARTAAGSIRGVRIGGYEDGGVLTADF